MHQVEAVRGRKHRRRLRLVLDVPRVAKYHGLGVVTGLRGG